MKLIVAIQSASDIITNSSSEVFLCQNNTEMTIDQLTDFIFEYNKYQQFAKETNLEHRYKDDDIITLIADGIYCNI